MRSHHGENFRSKFHFHGIAIIGQKFMTREERPKGTNHSSLRLLSIRPI